MPATQHGHFHWNELMTWNIDKAKSFYATTLGWTYDSMPMPDGEYLVCKSAGEPVGGLFEMKKGVGMDDLPDQWFAYIAVDDIDARIEQVAAAGGQIIRPPFDIPQVGRIAILKDAASSAIGWITPVTQ